jgi:tRNA(Ile)-lysidine synthase
MAPEGARLGVAVSGGADSVFLVEALRELGYELHVLHVNHGLRGEESEEDERFVRELARKHGLPVSVHRAAQPPSGANLEQELRRIRYRFFAQARAEHHLERVATGHTRSDQAETVLLRLARGSGVRGLCGIHPVTRTGIIRPLIETGRAEIRQWLSSRGLPWREDSSNRNLRWRRNRVREQILPILAETLNPRIEEVLARTAALAWEDEREWDRRAEEALEAAGAAGAPFVAGIEWLRRLGPALGRRVVRRLLAMAAGSEAGLTFEHADAAWNLVMAGDGSGKVVVPGAMAWRSMDWIRFQPLQPAGRGPAGSLRLEGPGEVRLGPWRIAAGNAAEPPWQARYNEVSELAPGTADFPLTVRCWQPGDRFHPGGGEAPVKLKELFQRARIPSWERAEWPMVEAGGRIVWCRGFGVAAWAAPARGGTAGLWIGAAREK